MPILLSAALSMTGLAVGVPLGAALAGAAMLALRARRGRA